MPIKNWPRTSVNAWVSMGLGELLRFKDGEIRAKIGETVRGASLHYSAAELSFSQYIMELLILIDAMKRASPRVCAVIPYYAYARQIARRSPGTPLQPSLANVIAAAGADRVVTLDLHAGRIRILISQDNLRGMPIMAEYLLQKTGRRHCGLSRCRRSGAFQGTGGSFHCQLAIVDKRRPARTKPGDEYHRRSGRQGGRFDR